MRSIVGKTTYYYAFIVLFSGVTMEVGGALFKSSTQIVMEGEKPTGSSTKGILYASNALSTKSKKQTGHISNSSLGPGKFGKPRKRRRPSAKSVVVKRDVIDEDADSSWPSFYDILEKVHRNMTHIKRDEFFNYAWSPYALTYSSKHSAPTMKPSVHRSHSNAKTPKSNQTEMFVYRKVYAFNRSILAISIRKTTTPSGSGSIPAEPSEAPLTATPETTPAGNLTHSRHFKKPQEHFRALSAAKARLHHRWLQKGNFKAKILT